jgi:hypothetical protein
MKYQRQQTIKITIQPNKGMRKITIQNIYIYMTFDLKKTKLADYDL